MSNTLQSISSVFDPFGDLTVADILDDPSRKVKHLVAAIELAIDDPILMRIALSRRAEILTITDDSVAMANYARNQISEWLSDEPRRDDETTMECLARLSGEQSPVLSLFAQINFQAPLDMPTEQMDVAALSYVVAHLTEAFDDEKLTVADVAPLSQQQLFDLVVEHIEAKGVEHDETVFDIVNQGARRLIELATAFAAVKNERQSVLVGAVA